MGCIFWQRPRFTRAMLTSRKSASTSAPITVNDVIESKHDRPEAGPHLLGQWSADQARRQGNGGPRDAGVDCSVTGFRLSGLALEHLAELASLFLGRVMLQGLPCVVHSSGGIVGGEVDQGEIEVDRRGVGAVFQGEAEVRDGLVRMLLLEVKHAAVEGSGGQGRVDSQGA